MIHFNYVQYFCSDHAEKRYLERSTLPISQDEARVQVIELAYNGSILLESDNYRYIQNGQYYLPCIKWKARGDNVYRIKTVMTWDMVENRLQSSIDKYAKEV